MTICVVLMNLLMMIIILVCEEQIDDDAWDEVFFSQLGPQAKRSTEDGDEQYADRDESDNEDDDNVEQGDLFEIKSYMDAIAKMEGVRAFLEFNGHTDMATSTSTLISSVVDLSYAHRPTQQSSITEYFQ